MILKTIAKKGLGLLPSNIRKSILADYRLHNWRHRKTLHNIEFHLAEHCNLNCAGCDHFSPLAEPEFADFDSVSKDMQRLAELSGGHISEIRLIGGEPLLHPDIEKFFPMVRGFFPDSRILLFNNGILLNKQPDSFWTACHVNNIVLFVTHYPINIHVDDIQAKCSEYNVEFIYAPGIREDEMYRCVLSLEGKENIWNNWKYCIHNDWTFLYKGKIYPCPFYANIRHFNKYFHQDLPLTDKDSIDIYQVDNMQEILDFLASPIPACQYCDISAYTYGHKWEISQKEIKEWT
jgi:MoaA/NifB/PqqE/SkfB family radical SAM enzyme